MKTASAGLKTLLSGNKDLLRIELLTITLAQGAGVYRYNSSDRDINYNGHTWYAGDLQLNPGFHRGTVTTELGTGANTMELMMYCGPNTVIGGVQFQTFAEYGGFDQAIIEIDCLPVLPFASNSQPDTSNGTYNIWTGIVGDVKPDRSQVTLEVSSMLRLLQGSFPRNYALASCNNTLYDAGCTLLKSSFTFAGTVAAGSWLTNQFDSTLTTQGTGYFALGWVVWTSGQNNGLVRTVKSSVNGTGQFTLVNPLPYVPQAGDTFNAIAGCDKTQNTCTTKFSNLANFRGYPFVPNPMTLLAGGGSAYALGGAGGASGSHPIGSGGGVGSQFKMR